MRYMIMIMSVVVCKFAKLCAYAARICTNTRLTYAVWSCCTSVCCCIVQWMFPESWLNVHWKLINCSLSVCWVFAECSLKVDWMFAECSLSAHLVFIDCGCIGCMFFCCMFCCYICCVCCILLYNIFSFWVDITRGVLLAVYVNDVF